MTPTAFTKEQLLDIVHQYYPRGLYEGYPEYEATAEAQRRKDLVRRCRWDEDGRWVRFIAHLEKTHPEYRYTNYTIGHGRASYVVRVWFPESNGPFDGVVAVAMVSYFAPVYSIYISQHSGTPGNLTYEVRFTPADRREAELVDRLAHEIEASFGVAAFPIELADVLVPDVSAGNQGIGETTLYDCLFTDSP